MTDLIDFYRHERGFVLSRSRDAHYRDLGSWLTSDIQAYAPDCLDVLSCVEDVRFGRSALDEWEGNSCYTRFTPFGVTVESLSPEGGSTTYTPDEAHSVMLQYWQFLTPTGEKKNRALASWEGGNEREHPCRPHLW
ncbi:hypothetical protein [Planosporangium mesophilum]|uniref:Uncharacterized protein n=1 Tax=Planosporangium mesophilum TaxID=689768 RepID=A0A8J3T520_9ACTN|nr:hypothetical protein [Planosporangium mesophilum]NJC81925.1 hypothetical protein [Planosporangium mesophilum]GII20413.1 hypothetical protein Pme01_00100 [Planosporangium mesophilum]